MSYFKETIPVAIPILIGLGFTFGVHSYSKADTTQRLEQIALKRAQEEDAQAQRQASFDESLNASVKADAARDAEITAQENAKNKEAEKAALIAALPGDPAQGKGNYMTCMACHCLLYTSPSPRDS